MEDNLPILPVATMKKKEEAKIVLIDDDEEDGNGYGYDGNNQDEENAPLTLDDLEMLQTPTPTSTPTENVELSDHGELHTTVSGLQINVTELEKRVDTVEETTESILGNTSTKKTPTEKVIKVDTNNEFSLGSEPISEETIANFM